MQSLRILIADDSALMRRIIERSLRQAGLELSQVLEAGNGLEALDVVRRYTLDLILSDLHMPLMDGLEFLRRLRQMEQARGVPVIIITCDGSESQVVEALSCGARGYICKPFTADKVNDHVLPLLQKDL